MVLLLGGGAPVSNKVSEGGGYQNFTETLRGGIHFITYRNAASLAIRGLLVFFCYFECIVSIVDFIFFIYTASRLK